jgi:hypothetical protein
MNKLMLLGVSALTFSSVSFPQTLQVHSVLVLTEDGDAEPVASGVKAKIGGTLRYQVTEGTEADLWIDTFIVQNYWRMLRCGSQLTCMSAPMKPLSDKVYLKHCRRYIRFEASEKEYSSLEANPVCVPRPRRQERRSHHGVRHPIKLLRSDICR